MKNFKKISAVVLVVAMLCSISVCAFAAGDTNAVVENSANNSEIQINSAVVTSAGNILTVTLDYSISGTVAAGDQITMLGYIFDGSAATGDAAIFVEGNIRAIDQADAVAENGKISFKLATAGEGYTVPADAKMVVKLGTNATSVTKAQAFLVDLAKVSEAGEPHLYGDVNGSGSIDAGDWMMVFDQQTGNYSYNELQLGTWQFEAADVNGTDLLEAGDWMAIFDEQTGNFNDPVVGTEFVF